ncbi:agmatine deiminase family protein [Candidatus Eisenbacteria bacterium]|uniref:Agmatine deiminase family protein n=1 Tax=Eiseniibacteriota bacterium TaxID=2212470 RepID=A0ABV6YKN0_UNCEI
MIRRRPVLAATVIIVLAVLSGQSANPLPPDPPPNPKVIDDFSGTHELVLTVSGAGGLPSDELNRAIDVFNATLNSGVKITIYTTGTQIDYVKEFLGEKKRVTIVELSKQIDNNIFGSGFVRDAMPISIMTKDAAGKKKVKYVIDTPQQGAGLIDVLIGKKILKREDVIRAPFKFDGGHIVTGSGPTGALIYVTDKFYTLNEPSTPEQVNTKITQYLGFPATHIVKLTRPTSEASGHSDMLVRPLPNGKVVVSMPGPGMGEDDEAALNANLTAVTAAVGAENVIQIPTPGESPVENYANAVIVDKKALIPKLRHGAAADQAAKNAYKAALPGYDVVQMNDPTMINHGGSIHCRTGNLAARVEPKKTAGKRGRGGPWLTFDAPTSTLCLTDVEIGLLAGDDPEIQDVTDPQWVDDPLLSEDVILELSCMELDVQRLGEDLAHFTGGTVRFVHDGANVILQGTIEDLMFWQDIDDEFLDIFGVFDELTIDNTIGSSFLAAVEEGITCSRDFYGFYMLSQVDLFDLSDGFTISFEEELDGVGVAFLSRMREPEPTGVFICHYVPEIINTTPPDSWCGQYDELYKINHHSEQVNRIDTETYLWSAWYVLSGFCEDKQFCGCQFGIGEYNPSIWSFDPGSTQPCWPPVATPSGLELPSVGWPGPGEGTALTSTSGPWDGNYLAVYLIAGYAYEYGYSGVIPLTVNHATGEGGFTNCECVPLEFPVCENLLDPGYGGMGINTDGIYAQPCGACCLPGGVCVNTGPNDCADRGGVFYDGGCCESPPLCPGEEGACCFDDGTCVEMEEAQCVVLGVWYGGFCTPNPCPQPLGACCYPDGSCLMQTESDCGDDWMGSGSVCDPNPCLQSTVCCVGDDCHIVGSENACMDLGGEWNSQWDFCLPNPCISLIDYADHDVGKCILTVTNQGILGFMDGSQEEGSGFVYPAADSANCIHIGGLWVGVNPTYVASRDYDADPEKDWTVSSIPNGHIWIDDEGISHQDIHASYTDSSATQPVGLFVDQESWAFGMNDAAKHHASLRFTIRNDAEGARTDLYAGIFLDIDIGNGYENLGGTDSTRNLVYVTDSSGVHVGAQLLDGAGEPPISNLTLVHNETYVWPNAYISEEDKYAFLSAADPGHIMTSGPDLDDYGVLVSAGPFSIDAGEEQLVAFAILGGESLGDLQIHADVAQMIHHRGFDDVREPANPVVRLIHLLPCTPNPFREHTVVRFVLTQPEDISLNVYDVRGRLVRTLASGWHKAQLHTVPWDGYDGRGRLASGGVYFLGFTSGRAMETQRVLRLR